MRVKSGIRLTLVAMLATAALIGTTAGPAAALCPAPASPDADGRVRTLPDGSFVGNNVYSIADDQSASDSLQPGQTANFEVKFKNRKTNTRGIGLHALVATGEEASFRMKVFAGEVNVTDAVFGFVFKYPGIAPGASTPPLRIQVKMKNSANSAHAIEVLIAGRYGTADTCGDRPAVEAGNFD